MLVHKRIRAEYGCPIPFFADRDPLSTLISALLFHCTRNRDTGCALRELQARFPS